ncbi:MAG: polysaccharide biosynthesis tyrosine autokinase [Akkermansiaceae bacterium]|nr:polysaccharide biosynthesis tyrosine autokinase [Akkermansiaceae bacterium]MCF7731104.1 polysaccharide biosynthesis tyrosine autokinase [Akkermansiaceae bacterium]
MQTTNQPNQSEAALHAVDYWQVVKNRYGVIILTLLLVFMTAAVITYVMPKKYESYAKIEIKQRDVSIQVFNGMNQGGYNRMSNNFFNTEFEKIKSRNSLMKVIESLDLVTQWGYDVETVFTILSSIVKTDNIRGTDLIVISVRHKSPEMARDIAAEVAKAYKDYRSESEEGEMLRGLEELKKQVRVQEDTVEQARKLLAQIVRTKGIIYYGTDSAFRYAGLDDENGTRSAMETFTALETERMQLESMIKTLLKYDADQLMSYAAGLDLPDNVIRTLYPKYLETKTMFEGAKNQGLGANHPLMKSKTQELAAMRKQLDEGVVSLRDILKAKLELATARFERAKSALAEKKGDTITTSMDRQDYEEAKKAFETEQEMLQQMRIRKIAEEISQKMLSQSIIVHDDPVASQTPVSPNVTLNLILGAVVGLIFGVGIAFFLEYIDTSVKSLEDVERYLQVPVLAVIPRDVGVLHKQSGMSPDAEAYRILRTNIEFNRKNPEDNSITVVSGGVGEGKSTTLVNLAYVCAQGGYTTLMIDADLRRPRLHTFFDINNSVGLTNYLTTELMLEDVILQTPVDNLYFMPSGILPADAAGILNSRRMSELIQDVKQRFDLVLVDSPPILGVSDASVLASEVDLTMIVVQHRKLPRNMLLRVKHAVENVGGNVIGVVLNNVDVRSDSQYQYYTSYYTYYAPAESQIGPPVGGGGGKAQSAAQAETASRGNDAELY